MNGAEWGDQGSLLRTLAYRLALGRRPTAAELDIAGAFLAESPLTELCRALFNVNEFVYLD